ncbi:MAG: hypothetical protein GEU86_00145 [Actinophytocola sp.]|nr:hypothetical protein [Actinophytocola sp.]
MSRRFWLTVAATALAGTLVSAPGSGSAATPMSPDLGMARLDDLIVETTSSGRTLLRFSATIVNVGEGPFELAASRPDTASQFTTSQRVYDSDGSPSAANVPIDLVYGGDGHNHWHVKDLEVYELDRLDNGVNVGTGSKGGFCFFDTTPYRLSLPGAPQSQTYDHHGCGTQASLNLTMGVSVGWGDTYSWRLPDQYIDITGLGNGKYRLHATADPRGVFTESDYGNNGTWVDISLSTRNGTTSVKVLGYGPTADEGPSKTRGNGNSNGNGNGH